MTSSILKVLTRLKAWKEFVEQSLRETGTRLSLTEAQLGDLAALSKAEFAELTAQTEEKLAEQATLVGARLTAQESRLVELIAHMRAEVARLDAFLVQHFDARLAQLLAIGIAPTEVLAADCKLLLARRSSEVLVLPVAPDDPALDDLGGHAPSEIVDATLTGAVRNAVIIHADTGGTGYQAHHAPQLIQAICEMPAAALSWLEDKQPSPRAGDEAVVAEAEPSSGSRPHGAKRLESIINDLGKVDFYALSECSRDSKRFVRAPPPFDRADLLPSFVPAEPKRRSVLFPQHCYYNFQYLARALRARGWDAVSLSNESPDSANRRFYHGEDMTIFDPNPAEHQRLLAEFFKDNASRFGIVHTYGVGILSLFPTNYDGGSGFDMIPWDFLEWKRRGVLIGYSHSGCLDGVSQSSFRRWSPSTCGNCVWAGQPNVCSDERNLNWGRKVTAVVDLYCAETDPPLDFKGSDKVFRAPLTFAIDPEVWRPGLTPPAHLRRRRAQDEVLVYHAMGNFKMRTSEGRNVKGTGAVVSAVEMLRSEGLNIRLDFVHDIPSIENRFVQVQADIIVDQLNYGRYAALAREGMMLGKPVVGRVNKSDGDLPATRCIQETTMVDADETTITDVLRALARDPARRAEIGRASREHAIRWWSADRLAERFERVYDHLRSHGRPPAEEDVP